MVRKSQLLAQLGTVKDSLKLSCIWALYVYNVCQYLSETQVSYEQISDSSIESYV